VVKLSKPNHRKFYLIISIIPKNYHAIINIELLEKTLCVEKISIYNSLGRITLRSDGVTVAVGIIQEIIN